MKRFLIAACAVFSASMAHGQGVPCGPYEQMRDNIIEQGGQKRFAGLMNGAILEMWIDPETGEWLILVLTPTGQACMPAAGMAGSFLEPAALGVLG